MTIGLFYVSLLVLGFLYSVISLLAGWISDVGGHFHLDFGGHADVPGTPTPDISARSRAPRSRPSSPVSAAAA